MRAQSPFHEHKLRELTHDPTPTWPHGLPSFHLRHKWELYAAWAFIAIFFAEFFRLRGSSPDAAEATSGLVAFGCIAVGAIGSVVAGAYADRLGRVRIAVTSMTVSAACALVLGWLLHAPAWVAVSVALLWGFAVVADSAQFSALVTEVAPAHAVGTALTLQTALGFLLTTVTLSAVPPLRDTGGWPLAFGVLALGPVLGIVAMLRFKDMGSAN